MKKGRAPFIVAGREHKDHANGWMAGIGGPTSFAFKREIVEAWLADHAARIGMEHVACKKMKRYMHKLVHEYTC